MALVDSLVHWWDLDTGAATLSDRVGSWDLTEAGTVTSTTSKTPQTTTASYFNNSTDRYDVTVAPESYFSTGFSVQLWVHINLESTSGGFVMKHRDQDSADRYFQILSLNSTGAFRATVQDDAGTQQIVDSSAYATATWYHLVLTHDVSGTPTTELWMNGVSQGTSTTTLSTKSTGDAEFSFANWNDTAEWRHQGWLWSAGMWTRVLTDAEIGELYNSGTGLMYDQLPGAVFLPRTNQTGGIQELTGGI